MTASEKPPILLGAIADDFTGATDLANTLVKQGMRVVQTIGTPGPGFHLPEVDAVVIALKSRTIPARDAVAQSLAALEWLQGQGARHIFFKYCSTFDSTSEGNIGPVADALMQALGAAFAIACPAFPTTGRTIYKGYLFVGDVLLSESGMRDHPLTPMRDANLVRVLGAQTPHKVGLVQFAEVQRGAEAIAAAFKRLQGEGCRYAIVDALTDANLMAIGEACADHPLVTGGSGVAMGLPENFRAAALLSERSGVEAPAVAGRAAVLAGSCSLATRAQVARAKAAWPSLQIDPLAIADPKQTAADALAWANARDAGRPILIYSSEAPERVRAAQEKLGRGEAGELIEAVFGQIARGLVKAGVRRLIVAGGETSGAVVKALGVAALEIGPEIDPGVPWTRTLSEPELALALKSGNFGAEDFFAKALGMLA